jgi:hypothetical protein
MMNKEQENNANKGVIETEEANNIIEEHLRKVGAEDNRFILGYVNHSGVARYAYRLGGQFDEIWVRNTKEVEFDSRMTHYYSLYVDKLWKNVWAATNTNLK